MANLIPLDEAAKMLGMTPEQLSEMRQKNEIFGMRDGSNWKFKEDEIARFATEHGIELAGAAGLIADDDDDLDFALSDSSADLLHDSGDLVLGEDSEELSFGTSDIKLAASGSDVLDGDDLDDENKSPSDTGKLLDGDDLELSEDDLFDDELVVQDSGQLDSSDLSSDFEDSDLVLDDSDSSNEVTIDSSDVGVSLSPTGSGISLSDEEPLELGGSDIDALELPEDDDVLSLDAPADADAATLMGASDDDFNLTPLEDSLDEDLSSGSQVIALEDSAIYTDDSEATILNESDDFGPSDALVPDDSGAAFIAEPAMGGPVVQALPEADYSLWNILSLTLALVLVAVGTMIAFDIARNMWQPEGAGSLTNSLLNFVINLVGLEP